MVKELYVKIDTLLILLEAYFHLISDSQRLLEYAGRILCNTCLLTLVRPSSETFETKTTRRSILTVYFSRR